MTPTLWLLAGFVLILIEVMTPTLISIFFGLSALIVAAITWLYPLNQPWQWILFSLFSIASLFGLRNIFKQIFSGRTEVTSNMDDDFTGRKGVVIEPITPCRPGRVEVSGSSWLAESTTILNPGTYIRVTGKKNLTLLVEAVNASPDLTQPTTN